MSSLVSTTHVHVRSVLDVTEDFTVTGMKFSELAMESLPQVPHRQASAGWNRTCCSRVLPTCASFCHDLRDLGLLELTRALYAIAALQRVFGPLSVPVRISRHLLSFARARAWR